MGRVLLVCRLAVRDLRRRRTEAVLLLLAVLAATTTLTLGLVLRGAASDPYEDTRAATRGPDVVANSGPDATLADFDALAGSPGVTDHSGPFPVTPARLGTAGRTSDVQAIGRDAAPASVDQPKVVRGDWVRDGGVVLEAAFASTLDVRVGDTVTLAGRPFAVAGVAVTSAMAPYPGSACVVTVGCVSGAISGTVDLPDGLLRDPGLVWLTTADAVSLAPESVAYTMNLRLADPDQAAAFVETYETEHGGGPLGVMSWKTILGDATALAADSQILLLIGAWLLGMLAVASLAVLVGGRLADQTRRVGLLKAVGGTPGLVAAVLLAEYVLVAVVAAAAGLTVGALTAPLLTESSAGLLGSAGTPSLTPGTIVLVTGVALGVAVAATAVPAVRAARASTVAALADTPRPPRRVRWLITLSTRLPVTLLLAARVTARRPRRVVLAVAGIAVTVSGMYVLMILDDFLDRPGVTGYADAQVDVLRRVLLVWMVVLLCLAAVNTVVITWATVVDNRHASALARALGATPRQTSAALAAAQVVPALVGALIGVFPGGFAVFAALMAITGGDSDEASTPSLGRLLGVVLATVLVVAALTAVPARLGGRRPVVETL